ncbi:YaeQ family protein [Thiohalomonas denitrificans]|nr:YaeQ family protein [Thiohalomonas denitrificans]
MTATIYKAELAIADMDRGYYATHHLTLARHPSETSERLMVRLLVFALHAEERLEFTKGLCADDEPAMWAKSLSGEIETWIDVGQPDERRIRKGCNRAGQVVIYAYGGHAAELWWERTHNRITRFDNLQVFSLAPSVTDGLVALEERSMRLQCTVQDGQIWLGNLETTVPIEPFRWYG